MGLFRAFAYPLLKNNRWAMSIGVVAFCIPQILAWALPMSRLLGGVLQALVVLYFALFFQGILETSMAGKVEFPAWPELPNRSAILEGVLSVLGPYVISFLPLIILRCVYSNFGDLGSRVFQLIGVFLSGPIPYVIPKAPSWFEPASWLLTALGMIYLPMALLTWSFFGGNSVLNPWIVFRSAVRAGGSYVLLVGLIVALLVTWWLAVALLAKLPFDWLRSVLFVFSLFYVLCVAMRMIGLHYFANRDQMGWEAAR